MSTNNLILYMIIFLCIILFFSFNKALSFLVKLFFNIILGATLLILANYILKTTGLYVAINPITAIISGILGLPGIICLYILKILL